MGQKPISAIVDITNYVMIDLNRPLHAYDADKIDKEVTGKKDNKRTKFWSSGTDVPGLIPAAAAGEVAQWLHERGIPPGKYQTAIAEAYTALINSNKRKVRELGSDKAEIESSLIPYLQEATVKVRLEDMTFINEKGKAELIPSNT